MNSILALAAQSDNPKTIVCVAAIIAAIIVGVAAFACLGFVVKCSTNAKLKQSMIERGMSADEIERVLMAKSK